MRESPALDVIMLLKQRGSKVTYSDPFVPELRIDGGELQAQDLMKSVAEADCTVVITDHTNVDYSAMLDSAKLVVDTRNALKKLQSDKLVRL